MLLLAETSNDGENRGERVPARCFKNYKKKTSVINFSAGMILLFFNRKHLQIYFESLSNVTGWPSNIVCIDGYCLTE